MWNIILMNIEAIFICIVLYVCFIFPGLVEGAILLRIIRYQKPIIFQFFWLLFSIILSISLLFFVELSEKYFNIVMHSKRMSPFSHEGPPIFHISFILFYVMIVFIIIGIISEYTKELRNDLLKFASIIIISTYLPFYFYDYCFVYFYVHF